MPQIGLEGGNAEALDVAANGRNTRAIIYEIHNGILQDLIFLGVEWNIGSRLGATAATLRALQRTAVSERTAGCRWAASACLSVTDMRLTPTLIPRAATRK